MIPPVYRRLEYSAASNGWFEQLVHDGPELIHPVSEF